MYEAGLLGQQPSEQNINVSGSGQERRQFQGNIRHDYFPIM